MLRIPTLIFLMLLMFGCSSKSASENAVDEVTKLGIISAKEIIDIEDVDQQESKAKTSVFASFSSGGRVSIGLGFLLFPFTSSEPEENPVRYEVNLLDGGEITLYHNSRDFEIDDCVEITLHEDMEKNPPSMKRNKGGC